MNVHPLFTHFPVALLTFYFIFELLRFKRLQSNQTWFYIKGFFLILGTFSGYATYITGLLIEEDFKTEPALQYHELFAGIVMIFSTFLAICYVIAWIKRMYGNPTITSLRGQKLWHVASAIQSFVFKPYIHVTCCLAGLALIFIVGALGGSMAYGRNVDPFVNFIYGLFLGDQP